MKANSRLHSSQIVGDYIVGNFDVDNNMRNI